MGAIALFVAYGWAHAAADEPLEARFVPPPAAARVAVAGDSFGAFLRRLPLLRAGTPVRVYDGTLKARQDVHAAVIDLDVGSRDLQQCADAVMRLWAEYRWARRLPIAFHPEPGRGRTLAFDPRRNRDRHLFDQWLVRVFAEAGTASLAAELHRVDGDVMPGDVLIHGGHPGHAVLVLDVAVGGDGKRWLLLGQSYMPAQQFHVLRNLASSSPWYDAAALATTGLVTPEWPRAFFARDVRRF